MDQLADLRVNLEMNLYFAPYIMSLIKLKTYFRGFCEIEHKPFRPFKNDIAFLQRPLTPFPSDEMDEEANENEGDGGNLGGDADHQAMPPPPPLVQPQWVPPAGYFDPYFASMQQGMSSQIDGLATQMQNQMNLGFQTMQQ